MLRVTPIYGSRFSAVGEAEEASCTLIEFSGCRCLVNVGWRETLPEIPNHDFVLITDSTLQALGGLPSYYEQQKGKWMNGDVAEIPPIYATYPTVKMGQMTLYDQHAALAMDGGRPPYSLQAVDDVFAYMTAIKYSQHIHITPLPPPSLTTTTAQLLVTAHRAGHVVGGAFYVLQRLRDETVVVITEATYHMAKELHLDSSTLLQHAATPDVLITRPGGPAFRQFKALPRMLAPLVSQAERTLTETVLSVLRRDGNVLLPVDCSGRVLELILLLNQEWEKQRLQAAYTLVWLAPMCHNVIEFARSQLEWMAIQLGSQFDGGAGHPFQLSAVHFCTSLAELNAITDDHQNPVCVLASGLSLEGGPARDVFLKWADNPDNAILFTDSSQCYLRRDNSPNLRRQPSVSGADIAVSDRWIKDDPVALAVPTLTTAPLVAERTTSAALVVPEDPDDVVAAEDVGLVGDALTTKSPWTTAGQLLQAWARAQANNTEMDDSVTVDVHVPVRAPLAGAELQIFLAREEAERQALQRAAEQQAMLAQVELAKGQLHLGEEEGETLKATTTAVAKSLTTGRPRKKSRFDSTLFLKFSKPLHCKHPDMLTFFGALHCAFTQLVNSCFVCVYTVTFEVREDAVGIGQPDSSAKYGIGESVGQSGDVLEDDYGISVQYDRFTDIVSGVDPSKFAGGTGRIGEEVLRRGFGYDGESSRKLKTASSNKAVARAIISEDEDQDEGEDFDEQAQEALDLSEGNGIIRGRNGRPPTKVSVIPRKVEVLAEVSFLPGLEGRVDARAARQSVRALQPREVIVLGGIRSQDISLHKDSLVTDDVSLLAEAAKSFATGSKAILTPSDDETAELAVGHAAYSVRLIDAPYQTIEEKEASESIPDPIEPFEAKLGVCNVCLVDCVATGQKVALDGSIVLAPRNQSSFDDTPSLYLSDGEILLTDLRAELIALGMKAEYSAHSGYSQLVVNGQIVVRKEHQDDVGKMHVEGPLCEDFYAVRSIVCGQYVTL